MNISFGIRSWFWGFYLTDRGCHTVVDINTSTNGGGKKEYLTCYLENIWIFFSPFLDILIFINKLITSWLFLQFLYSEFFFFRVFKTEMWSCPKFPTYVISTKPSSQKTVFIYNVFSIILRSSLNLFSNSFLYLITFLIYSFFCWIFVLIFPFIIIFFPFFALIFVSCDGHHTHFFHLLAYHWYKDFMKMLFHLGLFIL